MPELGGVLMLTISCLNLVKCNLQWNTITAAMSSNAHFVICSTIITRISFLYFVIFSFENYSFCFNLSLWLQFCKLCFGFFLCFLLVIKFSLVCSFCWLVILDSILDLFDCLWFDNLFRCSGSGSLCLWL